MFKLTRFFFVLCVINNKLDIEILINLLIVVLIHIQI